jgi:hypothetical protein
VRDDIGDRIDEHAPAVWLNILRRGGNLRHRHGTATGWYDFGNGAPIVISFIERADDRGLCTSANATRDRRRRDWKSDSSLAVTRE